ncbi:hypothetical protein MASR1M107_22550 [Ignavibacteriales bacterium]
MNFRSNIQPQADSAIQSYKNSNVTACNFLESIAYNSIDGFWMSTKVNAHLYYKDAFLAYIKFHPIELEFNQHFNMSIHSDTVDISRYLFGGDKLKKLALKHDLLSSRIVSFFGIEKMYVKPGAPKEFFDDLLELIVQVYEHANKVSPYSSV